MSTPRFLSDGAGTLRSGWAVGLTSLTSEGSGAAAIRVKATGALAALTVAALTAGGLISTVASATGGAGLNVPHGAAPTSPVNGDVWTTTAGMYARINGTTVGPFGAAGAGGTPGGADTQVQYNSGGAFAGSAALTFTPTAGAALAPTAVATGAQTALRITGAANTTQTASTEAIDVDINLARTVQFATGAKTTQRAVVIQAPTYAAAGASTITNAATFAITGAPIAGTNATLTNKYALWVQAGLSRFEDQIITTGSSASAPAIVFPGDFTTGLYGTSGEFGLSAAGSEAAYFTSASTYLRRAGTGANSALHLNRDSGTGVIPVTATAVQTLSNTNVPVRVYHAIATGASAASFFSRLDVTSNAGVRSSAVYGFHSNESTNTSSVGIGVVGECRTTGVTTTMMNVGVWGSATSTKASAGTLIGGNFEADSTSGTSLVEGIRATATPGASLATTAKGASVIVAVPSAFSGSTIVGIDCALNWAGTAANVAAQAVTGLNLALVINQNASNSGAYTGIKLNVTQTAVGTGTKRLLDLQVGGTSKFSVSNTGLTAIADTTAATSTTSGALTVAGGIGVGGAGYFGGAVSCTTLTASSNLVATGGYFSLSGGLNPYMVVTDGTNAAYFQMISGRMDLTNPTGKFFSVSGGATPGTPAASEIWLGNGAAKFGAAVSCTALTVGANQVVGAQGAAVADATGAGDVVAQLNALLARCRAHGLIAT